MVGLDSLRYDLEQWKLSKRNTDYYDEVLADAALVVLTTCEHICTHCEAEIEYAE
jgi:hypothetical protein